uniref:Uncharacterized protein n=1 Tax=Arundo donax TaxID=35708 RepID=A0A0A8Y477_ARUDO
MLPLYSFEYCPENWNLVLALSKLEFMLEHKFYTCNSYIF